MPTPRLDESVVVKLYLDQGLSARAIAEKLGTYPNKVRRLLKKLGVKIKNHRETQKELLRSGKVQHPTAGKVRPIDTKIKISEGAAQSWETGGDERREKQSVVFKQYWENMDEDEKAVARKTANIARHKASKIGSKFEIFVGEYLRQHGLQVIVHKKGMIINDNLELDILLPTEKIVIEIDGPTHHLPLHGEDRLKQQQDSDNQKNGLLLNEGFVVIRFKHLVSHLSEKYKRDSAIKILEVVKQINKVFPPVGQRLIYM